MAGLRIRITRTVIALAFFGATLGATLAAPGRHVLAGGPVIKAGLTTSGLVEVTGYYFSPSTKVQIYDYADGSKSGYALGYATTDASGHFDSSYPLPFPNVCPNGTATIEANDVILGWSNPVSLPPTC
jgi:hypothetical protein